MMRLTEIAKTARFRVVSSKREVQATLSLLAEPVNSHFRTLAYFYFVVGVMFVDRSPLFVAVPTSVTPLLVREHIQKRQLKKREPYSFRRFHKGDFTSRWVSLHRLLFLPSRVGSLLAAILPVLGSQLPCAVLRKELTESLIERPRVLIRQRPRLLQKEAVINFLQGFHELTVKLFYGLQE